MKHLKFAENLKSALYENNITQTQLARYLNTTQQTISRWLNGYNEPDFCTFVKLCEFLNETPNSMLGVNDEISEYNLNRDLSDDQQYILKEYNKLSSSDKQKIVNYMAVCSTKAEKKSDNSLTPMEEELITMTRKLEDKNQLAQILGFLEELLEDSNNRKKDTNSNNNHRNIG